MIEITSAGPIEVHPLEVVSVSYRIYNPNTIEKKYIVKLELPDKWNLISGERLVSVPPQESVIRIASFKVPIDTVSGRFKVNSILQSPQTQDTLDTSEIEISVLPSPGMELYPVGVVKAQLLAGEKFRLDFNVLNSGNVPLLAEFYIKYSSTCIAKVLTPSMLLGIGEKGDISVDVEIYDEINNVEDIVLIVSAKATQPFDDQTIIEKNYTNRFTVFPKASGGVDKYHQLPGKIKIRGMTEDRDRTRTTGQMEVSLKGPLNKEKTDEIDLLYRGPSPGRNMIFFSREESAHLAYETKNFGLFLGDGYFDLSPMIDISRSGRGAEIEVKFDDFTIDSFFSRTPKGPSTEEAIGIDLLYQPKEDAKLSFNFLETAVGIKRLPFLDNRQIWGVRGQFGDTSESYMDIEYARGGFDSRDDKDDAFRFEGRLHKKDFDLRFKHIDAGNDFPGYYRDQTLNELTGNVPIGRDFDIVGSWRQQRRNFGNETYNGSTIDDRFYRIGLDYNAPRRGSITLDYVDQTRRDIFETPRFDNAERYWRLAASIMIGDLTLGGRFELGDNEDRLRNETVLHISQLGMFSWRMNDNFFLSGFADYRRGDFFDIDRNNSFRTGLTVRYNPTRSTFLTTGFNCEVERNTFRRWNIPLTFRHRFESGDELEIRARHNIRSRGSKKDSDSAVMVEYSIPIEIPIERRDDIGTLTGVIRDMEKAGEGIPNVLVRVENKASLTDMNGRYVIHGINLGKHFVIVESQNLGANRITIPGTPRIVDISGGTIELNFDVVTAADINGRVFIPSNKQDIADKGLADILIELSDDELTERILTDESGRFNFEDLKPGMYKISIDDSRIPKHYHIEQKQYDVELKPGETFELNVRVVEDIVKVQIIQSGELSAE